MSQADGMARGTAQTSRSGRLTRVGDAVVKGICDAVAGVGRQILDPGRSEDIEVFQFQQLQL